MTRSVIDGENAARADLGADRTQPAWHTRRHALPFGDLSADEFEAFAYLLLLREYPSERVVYYGKTSDAGRDVVRTDDKGEVELIQCKRFTGNVGLPEIRGELAKLCANLFRKVIPVAPARVVFYAVPDLTAPAKDYLASPDKWIAECEAALEGHLKEKPSADLVTFAKTWWPGFTHEDEIKLTERARKQPDLIDEFFFMRPVVTGAIADINPELANLRQSVDAVRTRFEEVLGGPPATGEPVPTSPVGTASTATHPLQLRVLAAKVSVLEDRDRQHLDADGQRLIAEIQGAVRTLDMRQAVAAVPRLEAWIEGEGAKASPSVRGRTYVLLADLALIAEVEASGGEHVDTTVARRWHARAMAEFTADASTEYAARLAALEAKLLALEGQDAAALELAAAAPTDPACMTTRLSTLIERGQHAEAVGVASRVPLHERWCDRLVIAQTAVGDTAAAEATVAAAKREFDKPTHRRCLLSLARGRLQRATNLRPDIQRGEPTAPLGEAEALLRAALDDLRPLLTVAEANERVGSGLEAEAVAVALTCTRLLGDPSRTAALADLLATREPVHVEYARAAFRGDVATPSDLPNRLRRDHPHNFEARLLGVLLLHTRGPTDSIAFSEGLELVHLARSASESERAMGLLLELAAEGPDGAFDEVERIVVQSLGAGHRLTRFAGAARHLAAKEADQAAPLVEGLRDDGDPLWRQFAATLCLLRSDEAGALEHLLAASRLLIRPEVLESTALLAAKLGRDETAEEVLERLVALRPTVKRGWTLLASVCVRLGRNGKAARAFGVLRDLEPSVIAHGINHAKSLALAGRREEALRVYEAVCARHPHSLEALGGRAHLLDLLDRPGEAMSTLTPVREVFWSEPQMLLLYLMLGQRSGQEEEAHLTLGRLLELQREGRDVPLWTLTLDEVLEEFRSRRRALEERNLELLRGRVPWLAAGRAAGRPALGDWAYRTQELVAPPDDPQGRAELGIYSTNGWAVRPDGHGGRALEPITCRPKAGQPVVADLSALLTLHNTGLLGHAATYFGRILLPVSYAELALNEQTDYLPQQKSRLDAARQILSEVDHGRIAERQPASEDDSRPLLDEYADEPAYRLRDIITWLNGQGQLDERQTGELLAALREREKPPAPAPVGDVARRGFVTNAMTLEAAIDADFFPTLIATVRVSLSPDAIRELRGRLWGAEHQTRLARDHESLWAAIHGDARFEHAEIGRVLAAETDERDRRLAAVFHAPLLAEAKKLPLLADERAFQTVVINGHSDDPCAAFGTDCLLTALAESGAINEDELANAFLALIRWRYRFLVPPVRVLATLAARHRGHPPGGPLREISRYVHSCFHDPGLLAGTEPTDPPVSVAWESYRHWVRHVARFVVRVWHDDRFDDRAARELTAWSFGELLPCPPAALPQMGAVVLCHATAHHIVGTVYGEVWRFNNPERAARTISEIAGALRLTKTEYLEIAGDYLELLATQSSAGDNPDDLRAVHGLFANTALSPVRTVGPRVYFALARLGVEPEGLVTPPPDELAAVLDPAHPLRIANPPGPIVLLRIPSKERSGTAVSVPDYLLHPARAVRETGLAYLGRAPEGPTSWLSPRSRGTLAEVAEAVRSETQAQWLPAARRLCDVLEEDFLLNLAGFRQCWAANLMTDQQNYWRRVMRPRIHLAASIPFAWYEPPRSATVTEVAASCVGGATTLEEVLDRHFARYGHLPVTPPASAGSVVRHWARSAGDTKAIWDAVWRWVDAGPSPLRIYHACQVFIECPDLVPDGLHHTLWERTSSVYTPGSAPEDGETESAPDAIEVGWALRRELARHYLGQLELHTADQPLDRMAALAWWAAERVSRELTEALSTGGADVTQGLAHAIERSVGQEAELTDVAWDSLRPPAAASVFAFGTMEARGLWGAALLAQPGPGTGGPLPVETEPWVAITLLAACMGGFPPPGRASGSSELAFGNDFDAAAEEWARRIGTDEHRAFLVELLGTRRELTTEGGLIRLLRETPNAEMPQQAVVCSAFRSLAALGLVTEDEGWGLITDDAWIRGALTRLEPGPFQALIGGLLELQRQVGGRWHWTLPHLLASLTEGREVSAERRQHLALATVRSAAVGGALGAIRRLLTGPHQEELDPIMAEWRNQFIVVRTFASPIVAGRLRAVTAALSR